MKASELINNINPKIKTLEGNRTTGLEFEQELQKIAESGYEKVLYCNWTGIMFVECLDCKDGYLARFIHEYTEDKIDKRIITVTNTHFEINEDIADMELNEAIKFLQKKEKMRKIDRLGEEIAVLEYDLETLQERKADLLKELEL